MSETKEPSEPERNAAIGMRAGSPSWLPDAGEAQSTTNAAATGKLATSGRDDTLRGDTVSADTASGMGSSGRQAGAPTPGNRFPGAPEAADAQEDDVS